MDNASSSAQSNSSPQLGDALSAVLSNPELMSKISGIVGSLSAKSDSESAPAAEPPENTPPPGNAPPGGLAAALANPELMAKLPEVMATLAPMLSGTTKAEEEHAAATEDSEKVSIIKKGSPDRAQRAALLCALKPYLSPRRCEAIDYIIRLDRISDLLHTLT